MDVSVLICSDKKRFPANTQYSLAEKGPKWPKIAKNDPKKKESPRIGGNGPWQQMVYESVNFFRERELHICHLNDLLQPWFEQINFVDVRNFDHSTVPWRTAPQNS